MWDEVLKVAVSNGIFAVLFCALLIYELKVSGKREAKYQSVISDLSVALLSLKQVEEELVDCERVLSDICVRMDNIEEKKRENKS